MIGHHARHVHSARFISKIVQGGRLGKVCNGTVVCCSSGGLEQQEGDWRTLPGENPGGPLLQCGIHSIDFLLSLFGPVKRVMSMMQESITAHKVVDNTMTLLDFSCGVQFTLISNYTTAYMHSTDIFGTKANLHIHKHITGLGQEEMYLQERAAGPHEPWQALRIPAGGSYPDDHGGVLEKEFARQIRQAEYDYTNLNESIHALVILEAAVESHATGKAVIL
jgi:predicted dehydrogenase